MIALAIIAAVTMGLGIGQASFWEPDEPRFAEATRQMFLRHDFLTPYFNGVPRFEKPILFYWMQALAYLPLGATEFAARLPVVLSAIGCVFVLYLLGARVASRRAGWLGGMVLATMFRFVVFSREGLTDIPVLFFMMLALYAFQRASERPAARLPALAGWTCVGLGTLIKGPVGVLPPAVWMSYPW